MSNEIFCARLSPRCCMLDANGDLKLSDFWTENDNIYNIPLFQEADFISDPICETAIMRRDEWRFSFLILNFAVLFYV